MRQFAHGNQSLRSLNPIKQILLKALPALYFFLRDHYQFNNKRLSGELGVMESASTQIEGFSDAYQFCRKYIESFQIETEIQGLIQLIAEHQPRTFVEIGMADGGTHFMIRRLCPSIDKSLAIDTDIRNKLVLDRITGTARSHYIRGFSNNPRTLNSFKKHFADMALDLLFIDGDHSYEGVQSDFNLYAPSVRPGGLIVFHDIVEDWGTRFGRKTNKYSGGVPQFFAEIKDRYKYYTFIDSPDQDGFGIGVLIQP